MDELERRVYAVIQTLEAQPTPLPTDTEGAHFQYAPVPYRDAARTLADALDAGSLRRLVDLYDASPDPPPDYRPDQGTSVSRAFAWGVQWTITLSEVLFQARNKAVAVLREEAFVAGEARQLARTACLEIYAHLASEGVETEQFVADVRAAFPTLDLDTRMHVVEAVLIYGPRNPALLSLEALPGYEGAMQAWRAVGR